MHEEPPLMVDTTRSDFPADTMRSAEAPGMGVLENMASDALDRLKEYAREHPTEFGLWALGIGFILGWKLKPW